MTQNIRSGPLDRLWPGWLVVDRLGVAVGRIRRLHRPDPLAVADDGRRIGQASDIVAMLPGWSVHTLPEVSPAAAARLVREGYLEIVVRGRGPVRQRYAALTDITEVEDEVVRLAFCVDELPCQTSHRR